MIANNKILSNMWQPSCKTKRGFFTPILFVAFLLTSFGVGIVFEVFSIIFLALLLLCNVDKIFKDRKSKIIKFLFFCILAFIVFLIIHLIINSIRPDNTIKLYGMTKCIIFPCIVFLCFYKNNNIDVIWQIIILFLICINIVFFYIHVLRHETSIDSLGSVNVIGGLNVICLPLLCLKVGKRRKNNESIPSYILIALIIINAILFDATTYKILTIGYFSLLIISVFFRKATYKAWYCKICGIALIFLIILPLILVITDVLPEDNFLYDSRYIIWDRGFDQFEQFSLFEQFFGCGNNTVHMLVRSFEAHNITIDVLLIYGYLGLLIILAFFIAIIRYSKNIILPYRWIFMTSFIFYYVVCFMNPFFSGVLYFQVVSWITFMVYINHGHGAMFNAIKRR